MPATLSTDLDRKEAKRRLPEIRDIRDDDLQEQVLDVVVEHFPDYFWAVPATTTYHPEEHMKRHGLWVHTKRTVTVFERMSKSMVSQGHLTWDDIDRGRAVCILHDMFRYGIPPTETSKDPIDGPGVVAAKYLRKNTDLHDDIPNAVESHKGPWGSGAPPRSHLEQIVHIADMMASDTDMRVAVKKPHPVLEEQFPRLEAR